jgi:hypothetical protein
MQGPMVGAIPLGFAAFVTTLFFTVSFIASPFPQCDGQPNRLEWAKYTVYDCGLTKGCRNPRKCFASSQHTASSCSRG